MLENIILLVVGFINLFLTYIIFNNKKGERASSFFSLFTFGIFIWSFAILLFNITSGIFSIYSMRVSYVSAVLIVIAFFFFAIYFNNEIILKKIIRNIIYFSGVILSILIVFTPFFISNVLEINNHKQVDLNSVGWYVFAIYFILFFLPAHIILVYKYLKAKGVVKTQLKIVILSVFIFGEILGVYFNLILPSPVFRNWDYIWLGPSFTFVIVLSIFYAIQKYRFMDIRLVIKRSFIFTILVLLITSIFSASAFILSNFVQIFFGKNSILISGIITGIIVAIGFEPIKKFITKATDKTLFKDKVDPQIALSNATGQISSILDLKKLGEVIHETAYQVLKYSKFKVYIYNEKYNLFNIIYKEGKGGNQDLSYENPIYTYYENYEKDIDDKNILVSEELKYLESQNNDEFLKNLIKYLEKHDIMMVAPLYIKESALGFIFFGGKKSGDSYSTEDLNFVRVLAGQATVAFENAKLYEEQKQFSVKLQQEVNKATLELKSANKELKKLDQAKSEFISIASHQLRTPMTVIKGYMSMVQQGDFGNVPEKLNRPVENVLESSDRLLLLIEDLLNISRIESGRMVYDFEKTNLKVIVDSVYEELSTHAKKKGLEFIYHPPKEEIPNIIIDPKKIREVMMNLADNAIKYTDAGKVELFLTIKKDEIRYYVKDTGRGMNADDIGKLFKKFSRVDSSRLVHTEGTGLGLYIAKQIIKKHKGKIWADSAGESKGSMFAISLKIENPDLEVEMEKQMNQEKELKLEAKKKPENIKELKKADTIDMSRVKSKK